MTSKVSPNEDFSAGPADEFMRSLRRLNHALERASRSMEAATGVTAEQRVIIKVVGKYPGLAASRLAALLHLDAGTVSASLGRLERRGLVERRRGQRDKRRVTLGLTAAGRAVDQKVVGSVERTIEEVLEGANPHEVSAACKVLCALTDRLDPKPSLVEKVASSRSQS